MTDPALWTDEEARYLKAIMQWQDMQADMETAATAAATTIPIADNEVSRYQQQQRRTKPAGEFRILVLGAQGTGKTSILTRFGSDTFLSLDSSAPAVSGPIDGRGGCQQTVWVDFDSPRNRSDRHNYTKSSDVPSRNTTAIEQRSPGTGLQICDNESRPPQAQKQQRHQHQEEMLYVVDALELPAQHLSSRATVEMALDMTEAAVLVYDVTDSKSLGIAQGLASFILERTTQAVDEARVNDDSGLESLHARSNGRATNYDSGSGSTGNCPPRREYYALMLVGNKSDAPASDRAISWAEGSRAVESILTAYDARTNKAGLSPPPLSPQSTFRRRRRDTEATTSAKSGSPAAAPVTSNPATPPLTRTAIRCCFLEVSARTGDNVDQIFPQLGRDLLELRRLARTGRESEGPTTAGVTDLHGTGGTGRCSSSASLSPRRKTAASFWMSLMGPFTRKTP